MNLLVALVFVVTAYAPGIHPKMNGDRFDAYGLPVDKYTLACGPKYWSHVFIFDDVPGSKIRICSDTVLGGRSNINLDLALVDGENRYQQAIEWGRKSISVTVIAPDVFLRAQGIIDIPNKNIDKIRKIKGFLNDKNELYALPIFTR